MMTEQESRDWSQFASKVVDLIENETVEKSCNIPIANWTVEQCLGKLRAAVDGATIRQYSIESQQYELVRAAYFAQLAFTRLKNPSFDRKTAMAHLKEGKAVRPSHTQNVIALECLYSGDLTQFINIKCGTGKDKHQLAIPEQLVVATKDGGIFFMDTLPTAANEWVLATQEEIDAVENWTNTGKAE